jgi:hypothetical protein
MVSAPSTVIEGSISRRTEFNDLLKVDIVLARATVQHLDLAGFELRCNPDGHDSTGKESAQEAEDQTQRADHRPESRAETDLWSGSDLH